MTQNVSENAPQLRVDRIRLETLMTMRGETNKSLAEKTSKHPNSIVRLKKEQSIGLAELAELCAVLNCHPFDLLVAEGFPAPFWVAPVSH
jgi:DNA-binding Xre family transcriptional regulator